MLGSFTNGCSSKQLFLKNSSLFFSCSKISLGTSSLFKYAGLHVAICMDKSLVNWQKSLLRATKSDSQSTSTKTPILLPRCTYASTLPSFAARLCFFAAISRPCLRNNSAAFLISPLVSSSAFLQCATDEEVISLNSLIKSSDIFILKLNPFF